MALIRTMAAALLLAAASVTTAAPIEIRFSHVVSDDTPKGKMAIRFRDLVAERLGDRVVVSVHPNARLVNDDDVIDAMLAGDVQMAAPSLSKLTRYNPALQVFDLPFLFKDMNAVERFQASREGRKLLGGLKRKGIVGHGYLHNGMKQFTASKALKLPSDASGLTFQIQNSDVLQAQFETLGATPVKKPFSKLFSLLKKGQINGLEDTWSNIHANRFYEVQPHITESNHGVRNYLVVTSAEFWLGLDQDLRRELGQALEEAITYGNDIAARKADEDRKAIADAGTATVSTLTPAERLQWTEAMKPVWDQFESAIGRNVIAAAQAANQ